MSKNRNSYTGRESYEEVFNGNAKEYARKNTSKCEIIKEMFKDNNNFIKNKKEFLFHKIRNHFNLYPEVATSNIWGGIKKSLRNNRLN